MPPIYRQFARQNLVVNHWIQLPSSNLTQRYMIYDVDGPFGWMICRLRMVLLRREVLIHHRVQVIDCHRRFWLQIPAAKTWVRTYLCFKWMRLRGVEPVTGMCHRPVAAVPPRIPPGTLRSSPPRSAKSNSMISQFQMGVPGLMPVNCAHISCHVISYHTISYHIIYSNALMRPQWNDDL